MRVFQRFFVMNRAKRLTVSRRLSAAFCAFAACGAILACTPAYDWRTVMNNDDGYEITLPAKPRSDQREIQIAGQPMQMKMQTAEAGDAVFAVGTVVLPSADPALQRAALDFLQQGLARNVNAPPSARATQIELAAGGRVLGSEIDVKGTSGEKRESHAIHARFVARGVHVYQVAIVSGKEPPQEQADQFFTSFKLY
ncbi:hypothetical protein AWB67_01687 [Caballeronia terrestris]|uniref:Transmembrane protein n=2 Tax=Caballeronia terrestris TaxID=1226301 RepID=A0A158HEA1_9BURK|nr:hypothetical protein AWB67_01687 [Caballeronia terrestris]